MTATWQDRVDPAVAAAVGDGSGPLPVRLHPDVPHGPAVEVFWQHGCILTVAIYPDAGHGTVYRWDNGLDELPSTIFWRPATTAPQAFADNGEVL